MSVDKIELVQTHLNSIEAGIASLNTMMKHDENNPEEQSISVASRVLIDNIDYCLATMNNTYKKYYKEIADNSTQMVNSLNQEFKNIMNSITNYNKELNDYKRDSKSISKIIDKYVKKNHKEPQFCFKNNQKDSHTFDIDLVMKYPGCYLWELYKDPNMWMDNGDIYIDHNDDNYASILKYMKNDETLVEDVKNMDSKKRIEFVKDLDFLKLPVKVEYMNELCFNDDKLKIEAWKNRVIMVNGKIAANLNKWLKKNGLFDDVFNKNNIENIKYFKKNNIMYVNMNLKYGDFIEDYCKNGKINEELIKTEDNGNSFDDFEDELMKIGIELKEDEKKNIIKYFYSPLFTKISSIITDEEYDMKLQEWVSSQSKWKLIYKASEHNYTAKSFHDYCDNKKPVLIIIKSSEGWIFGGYTSVSWKNTTSNESEFKDDPNAFIFTLKNPHNIPPTKYNKRKESNYAIRCHPNCGPIFFGCNSFDICIHDNCNQSKECSVNNDGTHGFESDPQYKKSLFVKTARPNEMNDFSVSEYEVFTIDT